MRTLYLTLALFVQLLLATLVFYTSLSAALPAVEQQAAKAAAPEQAVPAALAGSSDQDAPCDRHEHPAGEAHNHKLHARSAQPEAAVKGLAPAGGDRREKAPDSPVVVNKSQKAAAVKGHQQQQQQQAAIRKDEVKGVQRQEVQEVKGHQRQEAHEVKGVQRQEVQEVKGHQRQEVHEAKKEPAAPQPYFDADKQLVPEEPKPAAAVPVPEVAMAAPVPVVAEAFKAPEQPVAEAFKKPEELEPKQFANQQPYRPNGGYGGNGYGGNQGGGQTIIPTGQQVVVGPNGGGNLVPGQQVTVISTGVVAPNGNGYEPYRPPYRPYKQDESVEHQSSPAVVVEKQSVGPVVKGGLGPLHMLATTLCSYQPDKPVADESLSLLYSRRAALRKSLFDFMSLKFTSLERFSSRLNSGVALEVVPPKIDASPASSANPTHGWPVVGKCTAHDLKLMAEAAWCECDQSDDSGCAAKTAPAPPASPIAGSQPEEPQAPASNRHLRAHSARFVREAVQTAPVPVPVAAPAEADKSAIISKLLHVADVKEAPVVESTIASLNLTQQQLAAVQAQADSRECRKNALRMTKALFNHLSEDQRVESSSWPKLHAQMSADECARKRMIDIVSALATYRTEASSIRRDNVEYAFAMDDLRTKVLESELNAPLTFDKQFIEVGQFLQQSVKLMLTNIDPGRAKLTSMRYRSLMPGPVSADDQCIELHQRLLAKNYPTDCNPTQFGQLPDVLRMAASSLELWSIESELAKHNQRASGKPEAQLYAPSAGYQEARQEVNECIANLVSY